MSDRTELGDKLYDFFVEKGVFNTEGVCTDIHIYGVVMDLWKERGEAIAAILKLRDAIFTGNVDLNLAALAETESYEQYRESSDAT